MEGVVAEMKASLRKQPVHLMRRFPESDTHVISSNRAKLCDGKKSWQEQEQCRDQRKGMKSREQCRMKRLRWSAADYGAGR